MESETATDTREKETENVEFLLQLQNPPDPAYVKKHNIAYNVAFTEFTNSIGPCRQFCYFQKINKGIRFRDTPG